MSLVQLVQVFVIGPVLLIGGDRFLLMLPIGVHCALVGSLERWTFRNRACCEAQLSDSDSSHHSKQSRVLGDGINLSPDIEDPPEDSGDATKKRRAYDRIP